MLEFIGFMFECVGCMLLYAGCMMVCVGIWCYHCVNSRKLAGVGI